AADHRECGGAHGGLSSWVRYEGILPGRARDAGFHVPHAEAAPPRLFGHRFVGGTGWYDYKPRNNPLEQAFTPEHHAPGRFGALQWSDKLRVVWPGDDGVTLLDDPAICGGQ